MTTRKIEIFSAGCPTCQETIDLVNNLACNSCEISVVNMHNSDIAVRAKSLGIQSVPVVVINGKLADCCASQGPDELSLREAGLGQS